MSALSVYLPPFASDYTGACSALFDFSSLVVINDAHCCTGTYVHFDEPRWAQRQRPTLCTMLRTIDAVFGNDEKVISQVTEAAAQLRPDFVALLGSPVPAIIGMDLAGIASEIEARSKKPVLGFATTGFSYYDKGISAALLSLFRRFSQPAEGRLANSINLLGLTPLDYGGGGNERSLRAYLAESGFTVNGSFCMETNLEQVRRAGAAAANLVVSASGLPAAAYLFHRFGTPWLAGCPMGPAGGSLLVERLAQAVAGKSQSRADTAETQAFREPGILLVGDQIIMNSLRDALRLAGCDLRLDVASFFSMADGYMQPGDRRLADEAQLISLLHSGSYQQVIGDPLLMGLPCPEGLRFSALPHPALSSRLYWRETPDYCALDVEALLPGSSMPACPSRG